MQRIIKTAFTGLATMLLATLITPTQVLAGTAATVKENSTSKMPTTIHYANSVAPLSIARIYNPPSRSLGHQSVVVESFTKAPWRYTVVYRHTGSGWGLYRYSAVALNPSTLQPLFKREKPETESTTYTIHGLLQPNFTQPPIFGGGGEPQPVPIPPNLPAPAPPANAPPSGHGTSSPCGFGVYHGQRVEVKVKYVYVADDDGQGGHWVAVEVVVTALGGGAC